MILVDTNVWSESTKGSRSEPRVIDWLRANEKRTLLSVIVIGEIEQGIAMTSGPEKRRVLEMWKRELLEDHVDRLVGFDLKAAVKWGQLTAPFRKDRRSGLLVDCMLAAQALTLNVPFATRNAKDFRIEGVDLIDPWEA